MKFDSYCSLCMLTRECRRAHELLPPEQAHHYIKDVMNIMANAPEEVSAPYLIPLLRDALDAYGIHGDLYAKEKKDSNDYVLSVLPQAEQRIQGSADPLLTAMKYAQAGNFLDFGVLTRDQVDAMLENALRYAPEAELDPVEYGNFRQELLTAKKLLIIGDNAGEIALDTLLVKELQKEFPALEIVYAVRGGNALNDATREDAVYVGMDRLVPIIDNGTRISGTELDYIGEEMRRAIEESDVILAKGQANFETMATCGYNVYYNFLCKCDRLCRILHKEPYTGQFLAERRLPEITPFPE